jgi:hypothetical protein
MRRRRQCRIDVPSHGSIADSSVTPVDQAHLIRIGKRLQAVAVFLGASNFAEIAAIGTIASAPENRPTSIPS